MRRLITINVPAPSDIIFFEKRGILICISHLIRLYLRKIKSVRSDYGQQNRPFIRYIAYLQIIGIIFVVLGHSFHEYPDGQMGTSTLLYRMMYNFRMPLFMFVSGFLMVFTSFMSTGRKTPGIGRFVLGKILRLGIPFLTLSLVTFIPRSALSGLADDNVSLDFVSLWHGLVFTDNLIVPLFWFLQASFILLVFTFTYLTLSGRSRIPDWLTYTLLIILFLILPEIELSRPDFFSIGQAFRLGIYFALGAAYARFGKRIDNMINWHSPATMLGFALLWAILFFVSESYPFTYRIASLAGIAACISLAHWLDHRRIGILDHLTGANYIIFLLSWYLNVAAQQVLRHFVELPWICYTLLSITAGIYVPWAFYVWMRRHPDSRFVRGCAFFLGQNLRKKR